MPVYLAGRDEDIKNIENLFDGLMLNIPTQSVIFSGLRGVGKTVLINRLQTIAEEKGIFCRHIEVEERNDFIFQIASCSQAFLRKISTVEKFKHLIQKPLDAIKALVVSFDPGENTFSLSVQERELYTTVNLTQSLTDVFCTIGEAAGKAETPICFFIDEIQYMKSNELGALIAALHRANQLGYPVMIVGADFRRSIPCFPRRNPIRRDYLFTKKLAHWKKHRRERQLRSRRRRCMFVIQMTQ